jgi:hypothetical protein
MSVLKTDSIEANIAAKISINSPLLFSDIPVYANNAAAKADGLVEGDIYRTGGDPDLICVVH